MRSVWRAARVGTVEDGEAGWLYTVVQEPKRCGDAIPFRAKPDKSEGDCAHVVRYFVQIDSERVSLCYRILTSLCNR